MGGEIQETSKKSAVKAIEDGDMLQEVRQKREENKPLPFLSFKKNIIFPTYCLG